MVAISNGKTNVPLVCVKANEVEKLTEPVFKIEGVPVDIVIPAPLSALVLKSVVPLTNVICLVAPSVKLLAIFHTAVLVNNPNVQGKS